MAIFAIRPTNASPEDLEDGLRQADRLKEPSVGDHPWDRPAGAELADPEGLRVPRLVAVAVQVKRVDLPAPVRKRERQHGRLQRIERLVVLLVLGIMIGHQSGALAVNVIGNKEMNDPFNQGETPRKVLTAGEDAEGRLDSWLTGVLEGEFSRNRIKSLIEHFGGDGFPRLKFGIGGSEPGNMNGHVLGNFRPDEREVLENTLARAVAAVQLALSQGLGAAANFYNSNNGTT